MSVSRFDDIVGARVLNALYDAGGSMPYDELRTALAVTGRQVWRAVYEQHNLGTIRRHRDGQPVELTVSARIAVAAGRQAAA